MSAEGQGQVGWEPGHALGGHYGAVVDMCWGVDGSCLLTASTDQTCRITTQSDGLWPEIARPQVNQSAMHLAPAQWDSQSAAQSTTKKPADGGYERLRPPASLTDLT